MELVIFVGLQGSGKTTFYRLRFAASHVLVSKDRFRNNRHPNRRQTQLITEALRAGQSVVVDNTNPTAADRLPGIQLGRSFGAPVIGYYFEPDVEASLERNRRREGKARVPNVAVHATAKRLEPPTYAEGFDRLYRVRPAGGFSFIVCDEPSKEGADGRECI
jgi:predicted kinase